MVLYKEGVWRRNWRKRLAFIGAGLILLLAGMAIGVFTLTDVYTDWRNSRAVASDNSVAIPQRSAGELLRMIEANPNDTAALFEVGRRFYQAGLWQDTVSVLTRMLEADSDNNDPNNYMARVGIGNSNFNLKNYAEAKKAWDGALEINPNDAQLHFNLGVYYATINPPDKDAAKAEWEKVISLVPDTDLALDARRYIETYTAEEDPTSPVPSSVP